MSEFEPGDYGPVLCPLLEVDRCRALDDGDASHAIRDALADLSVATAFGHADVVAPPMARCCLSGVWLLHDFLDESHTISQAIHTPEGSYWHAIMHRREGDFSNAKYWFRHVGDHPVFSDIDDYEPFEFVDACRSALRAGGSKEALCREIQQQEWERLFDYCYRQACE